MSKPIVLHQAKGQDNPQRLNAFPGRSLSEHAFDLMQAYVDRRSDPLLDGGRPGIIEGLQLNTYNDGNKMQLHVQPGSAVGGDGRAIRVFYPIELDWQALMASHLQIQGAQAQETPHGFYFITVRRRVGFIEDAADALPCTRDELNPLRDSRIETFGTLDLQLISSSDWLMNMPRRRAINRLCVRHIQQSPFDADTGAVPLAIVRIEAGTPEWVDCTAGRLLAQPNAAYHAFAAHWEEMLLAFGNEKISALRQKLSAAGSINLGASLARLNAPTLNPDLLSAASRFSAGTTLHAATADTEVAELDADLSTLLGVDYMPAAGRFPDGLISNIAGHDSGEGWALPAMRFDPKDLQIEVLPVPAGTAFGVIDRELPRGVVDLVHVQGDRVRVMVAIEDRDYRPDLMDLPDVDHELMDELFLRAQEAIQAELDWALAHRELYQDLDRGLLDDEQPTEEALALLKNTYLRPGYDHPEFPDYPSLPLDTFAKQRKQLGIPEPIRPAITPEAYFADLKASQAGRPYSNTEPSEPDGYELPQFPGYEEDGLYRQSADLADDIEWLEASLEESFDLIDEFNDFLSVQRQHLDAITTNFAALAGGVAGDGSGLRLMRWNSSMKFKPAPKPPSNDGDTSS